MSEDEHEPTKDEHEPKDEPKSTHESPESTPKGAHRLTVPCLPLARSYGVH